MIQFNHLFVIPNNAGICIDCQIMAMPYFTNVYIDKIIIHTQDTYNTNITSTSPVFEHTVAGNTKFVQLTIDKSRILTDMENKIFFVCVVTKGTPSSDTPCGLDNKTTIGVTYDDKKIYDQALSYISQAYNECSIPRDFIDFILRYKALKICIKSQNYLDVIKYWNKFINSNNSVVPKCGCNG